MTGVTSGGEATLPPGQQGDGGASVFLIEYVDGFKATMLGMGSWMVPRLVDDGEIYGDWGVRLRNAYLRETPALAADPPPCLCGQELSVFARWFCRSTRLE